jgi:hypothetical protein
MAHRSKKKHIKHVHQHEPATPKAKSPTAKAEAAAGGVARKGGNVRRAPDLDKKPGKKKGIVRRMASKATKKITAQPRKIIARAKASVATRVKSLLDR